MMIRSNGYTLTCDGEGCKRKKVGWSEADTLTRARVDGWATKFIGPDWNDFCPACAKKEADREQR